MTFEQWAWGRGFSLPQMDVAKMAWEAALKAQAGEPVAWAIYISGEPSDVFMHKQFAELECARRDKLYPDPTRQFVPLFTHPTTERPYNAKVTGSPALSASPSGLPGYATEVEK